MNKSTALSVLILLAEATLTLARGGKGGGSSSSSGSGSGDGGGGSGSGSSSSSSSGGGSRGGGGDDESTLGFDPNTPPQLIVIFAFNIILAILSIGLFGWNFLSFKRDPIHHRPRGPFALIAVVTFLYFMLNVLNGVALYGSAAANFSYRLGTDTVNSIGLASSFFSLSFVILLLVTILILIRAIRTHFAAPNSTTTKLPSRLGRLLGIIIDGILLSLVALFGIVTIGLRGYLNNNGGSSLSRSRSSRGTYITLLAAYNGLSYTRTAFTLLAFVSVIIGIVFLRRDAKCKPSKVLLVGILPLLSFLTLYTFIDTIISATVSPLAAVDARVASTVLMGLCNVAIMGLIVWLGVKVIHWKRDGAPFSIGNPIQGPFKQYENSTYSPVPSHQGSLNGHSYNPYPAPIQNNNGYSPNPTSYSQPQWNNITQPYDPYRAQTQNVVPSPPPMAPVSSQHNFVSPPPPPQGLNTTYQDPNQNANMLAAENEALKRRLAELEGRPVV